MTAPRGGKRHPAPRAHPARPHRRPADRPRRPRPPPGTSPRGARRRPPRRRRRRKPRASQGPASPDAPVTSARKRDVRGSSPAPRTDTTCSSEPWPLLEYSASASGGAGSGAALTRRSSSPSTIPNSRCRQVAWAHAARLRRSRQLVARRMESIGDGPERPQRDVLGQGHDRCANRAGSGGRARGGRSRPRTAPR